MLNNLASRPGSAFCIAITRDRIKRLLLNGRRERQLHGGANRGPEGPRSLSGLYPQVVMVECGSSDHLRIPHTPSARNLRATNRAVAPQSPLDREGIIEELPQSVGQRLPRILSLK